MQGKARKLPAELQREHRWRSQPDAFAEVWDELRAKLAVNARLQVKTLFDDLQRRYPCPFADGQIRTPQRRVKQWRATEGPPKDVFFEQVYTAGERSQSEFTYRKMLGATIQGEPFHTSSITLSYRNRTETGTICYSESFEAVSDETRP